MKRPTDGPWRIVWQDPDNEGGLGNRFDICAGDEEALEGFVVAADIDVVGRIANAHLLVSAPLLLAALKDIVPRFRRCCISMGSDPVYANAAVEDAIAVIDKAEGRK